MKQLFEWFGKNFLLKNLSENDKNDHLSFVLKAVECTKNKVIYKECCPVMCVIQGIKLWMGKIAI